MIICAPRHDRAVASQGEAEVAAGRNRNRARQVRGNGAVGRAPIGDAPVAQYHPPYHPELNPQERIWRRIRYEETTNHCYASPQDLERGVLNKVASWSDETIRSLWRRAGGCF